jgi:ribosomal protein S7
MIIVYNEAFFKSKLITKLINIFFFMGLKERLEKIIYFTFKFLKYKLRIKNPLLYFFECVEKLRPIIWLKKRISFLNKAKKSQYTPYCLNSNKSYCVAIHWLYFGIILQKKIILLKKIFNEIVNINVFNTGITLQKKYEHYYLCVQFKHTKNFRW